jgi:hypothetical protein
MWAVVVVASAHGLTRPPTTANNRENAVIFITRGRDIDATTPEGFIRSHHQHRSAWTLELDVRPWSENF